MNIRYNGSKWAGQEPDTLDVLFRLLAVEPLNPLFEQYGNFVQEMDKEMVECWGNFLNVSHVFSINGTEEEMAPLMGAIRFNQQTHAYVAARNMLKSSKKGGATCRSL